MISVFYVAAGGAIGSVLRYLTGKGAIALFGHGFPYATLLVNIGGSLAMGLLIGTLAKSATPHGPAHLFLAVGLLGGFTTFSTFSLDAVSLLQRGELLAMALYVLGSVVLSILALFAGLWLVRSF